MSNLIYSQISNSSHVTIIIIIFLFVLMVVTIFYGLNPLITLIDKNYTKIRE